MDRKASLLCVGNEVVDGQITNTNASWLSERLDRLGFSLISHLVVRDEVGAIQRALGLLQSEADLILVVGGLGPTRDDLTRRGVAQWLGLPLELDESSWSQIQDKLNKRQVPIRDGHRQQALFPKGAKALLNQVGVAPGFLVKTKTDQLLACLPGPPNELQDIFNNQLKEILVNTLAPQKTLHLQTWVCLGAAESEIAHIVESLLGEEIEVGFRLSRPYVEVKLWLPRDVTQQLQRRLQVMEEKINPWLVGRSIQEIREKFYQYLQGFQLICLVDHVTEGLFLQRLREHRRLPHLRYQSYEANSELVFTREQALKLVQSLQSSTDSKTLWLSLLPAGTHSSWLAFQGDLQLIQNPERLPLSSELGKLYVIEKCLLSK